MSYVKHALLVLAVALAAPALAAGRPATLTVINDQVCTMMGRSFPTKATDIIPLTLPETSGKVIGDGNLVLTDFINPPVNGTSHYEGEVREDSELILTLGRWTFPMSPSDKHGPIIGGKPPVTIRLDPGAEVVEDYTDASVPGAVCTGTLRYRIDFKRETERWKIDLLGQREVINLNSYPAFDPGTKKWFPLTHEFGIGFTYRFTVEVELERRNAAWSYRSGRITKADVTTTYDQSPEVYKTLKFGCTNCNQVMALNGKAINGEVLFDNISLDWPQLYPEGKVESKFNLQCASGAGFETCERNRLETSSYSDGDTEFFTEAVTQWLPLVEGIKTFDGSKTGSTVHRHRLVHQYNLTKLP